MALTATEKAAERGSMIAGPSDSDAPDYPWGLRLRLTEREMEKMGVGLPDVAAKLTIIGTGKVVEVYANDGTTGKRAGFELVVTDLGLAPEAPPSKSAAETIYGPKEG